MASGRGGESRRGGGTQCYITKEPWVNITLYILYCIDIIYIIIYNIYIYHIILYYLILSYIILYVFDEP